MAERWHIYREYLDGERVVSTHWLNSAWLEGAWSMSRSGACELTDVQMIAMMLKLEDYQQTASVVYQIKHVAIPMDKEPPW